MDTAHDSRSDDTDDAEPFPDLDAGDALRAAFRMRASAPPEARRVPHARRAAGEDRRDYVVEGEIARGGMGIVLKAFDHELTRDVALKVLRDELAGEPRFERRFLAEARITARLDHPGIVPVHHVGFDSEGRAFFAMRLVRGRDLGLVLLLSNAERDGWSQTRALSVILKVCEAMAYAHDKGVIHRDLKPSNVMVGELGEVYVMDWGLARVIGGEDPHDLRMRAPSPAEPPIGRAAPDTNVADSPIVTVDGEVLGTPCYMAPEQAEGRIAELGPRSDVYSVGAMLYHLLANEMPYVPAGTSVSSRAVLAELVRGPPRALSELRRGLPAELIAICETAMARDPRARYAGMLAMAEDLRAFLERRVVRAYETGAWAETKQWVRRNKPLAAALGAAIVLLVAGLTASLVFKIRADESAALAVKREQDTAEQARIAEANAARATEQEHLATARAADLAVAIRSAEENERTAIQRAEDVLSLSAIQDLKDLADRADALWPADPERVAQYDAWLADARALIEGRPEDSAQGVKGRPSLAEHEAKLAEIRRRAKRLPSGPGDSGNANASETWEFEDGKDRWWHAQLSKLVADLSEFTDAKRGGLFSTGTSEAHGWGIPKRAEFARTVRERSVEGPDAERRWDTAIAAIAKSSLYGGLHVVPQVGLVPIGEDPHSHLWEFAHLATGEPAVRGSDGTLVLHEEMGLVFVLIAGGTFRMGAQSGDPAGSNYDPHAQLSESPVHEVTLSPYFLSKYEMTQGQWKRFTGRNPSGYGPVRFSTTWNRAGKGWTALHPVEQVTWWQCLELTRRLGISLPSEAQWENGARGGTSTMYWTGSDLASLMGAANLSDAYGKTHGNEPWTVWERDFDDGNTVHAEVGAYRANPFGLHEVHGNVWEWCLDGWDAWFYGKTPGRDPIAPPTSLSNRAIRGGGYNDPAEAARAARRQDGTPNLYNGYLGLRPAGALAVSPPPLHPSGK